MNRPLIAGLVPVVLLLLGWITILGFSYIAIVATFNPSELGLKFSVDKLDSGRQLLYVVGSMAMIAVGGAIALAADHLLKLHRQP